MKKFEDILIQCIDDIKAGRFSIEDCLNMYPSVREQLEPLLKLALAIREPTDIKPSPSFKAKARGWLIEQIRGAQTVTKWPWVRYDSRAKAVAYRRRFSFSMASVILAIVLTLSALGAGTIYAAQDSLPGDALYPVKLGTEQVMMISPGDDVAKAERALSFADKRVREMEALAKKGRSQDLELAVQKYGYAMNMAIARMEQARNRGLDARNVIARVAEATTRHLLVLDRVYDIVPDEAKTAIAHARDVSETGYFHALAALAKNNTVRAAEMNLAAMEGRLNRVRATAGDAEAAEIALAQFEAMAEFNEQICQIARERRLNTIAMEVEELIAEATSGHLKVLAEVWDKVPEQAKPAVERAMANLQIRHQKRIQALEQNGVQSPPPPVIPERLQERIQERMREREQQGAPYGTTPSGQGVPGAIGQRDGQGRT